MLFAKLNADLPSSVIRFIRQHDFASRWRSTSLDPLYTFSETWDDASHEFLDSELESLRKDLLSRIESLRGVEAIETFPSNQREGYQEVPPEWNLNDRDRYLRTVKAMNDASTAVWDAHEALVRRARNKLDE